MGNMKAGMLAAIITVVLLIVELIMYPIVLTLATNLNSTCVDYNKTSEACQGGGVQWVTASDRTTLANLPTLLIVIVLFTALGGMIASIFLAVKGNK